MAPPAKKQKQQAEPQHAKDEELEDWEGPGLRRIKKRLEGMKEEELPELEPLEVLGTTVPASIVAKFDHCYLVKVQLGREKLHGVLYHAPSPDPLYPFIPPPVITTGLSLEGDQVVMKRPMKRKVDEGLKKDRSAPNRARTGYNFYFSEARGRDRESNPGRDDQERSAVIGEQWRKMSAEERQPYQEMAQKDKDRYAAELALYRDRLNPVPDRLNPAPVQSTGEASALEVDPGKGPEEAAHHEAPG